LEAGGWLDGAVVRGEAVTDVKAKSVEAQTGAGEQLAGEEAEVLLQVGGGVGDASVGGCKRVLRLAVAAGVEADVDVVVVEVGAGGEIAECVAGLVGLQKLEIGAVDEAGVVLLYGVAVDGVVEEKSEVRIQVEQGARGEGVEFPDCAGTRLLTEIASESGVGYATSFAGIEEAEGVEAAGVYFIEGDLAGGVVGISAAGELDGEAAKFVEALGDVGGNVVATVVERFEKWAIGTGAFVS
jgi:hypothetical protein